MLRHWFALVRSHNEARHPGTKLVLEIDNGNKLTLERTTNAGKDLLRTQDQPGA